MSEDLLRLRFKFPSGAIISLESPDLPDFTIITGLNGTGKTHLLTAISTGAVETNFIRSDHLNEEIRYFSPDHLAVHSQQEITGEEMAQERAYIHRILSERRGIAIADANSIVAEFPDAESFTTNPAALLDTSVKELENLVAISANFAALRQRVKELKDKYLGGLNPDQREGVERCAKEIGRPLIDLTENDLRRGRVPSWGSAQLFSHSIARAVTAYREALQTNLMAKAATDFGKPVAFLTSQEFEHEYKRSPWDMLNDTLRVSGLKYVLKEPDVLSRAPYKPLLTKGNVEIPFESLSSGERIILSLALVAYYSTDDRQAYHVPKLILLDEIDASLHPALTQSLLRTIDEILIKNLGAKVIMTTHSPSTVALADKENIYVMRSEPPRLEKATKAEALNILTEGVPTLALSYDGRRQVFCESLSDAVAYAKLWEFYVRGVTVDRSLEFVATGVTSDDGKEVGSGKDAVKSVVTALEQSGAVTCFGIIDWDLKDDAVSDRIEVLAKGQRCALENIIYDPLYLALLFARDYPLFADEVGIGKATASELLFLENSALQSITDAIVDKIFNAVDPRPKLNDQLTGYPDGKAELVPVTYTDALSLKIDKRYLLMDGHKLERKLIAAFAGIIKSAEGGGGGTAGKLMKGVASKVLRENSSVFPVDVRRAFENLLNRDAHL